MSIGPPPSPPRPSWSNLAADESGAAYTLSYVMVIPVYALLMCLIIETVLMLTAKLGTVYSAYAAARAASVWSSAAPWEVAEQKARYAAFKCMAPFASGTQTAVQSVPLSGEDAKHTALFLAAYKVFGNDAVAEKYLLAKFGYSARHTKVKINGPPAAWNADITAEVSYEFPFNVPGIGRILGRRGIDGRFYYTLVSQATIPNEGPQNNAKTLGIGYGLLQ